MLGVQNVFTWAPCTSTMDARDLTIVARHQQAASKAYRAGCPTPRGDLQKKKPAAGSLTRRQVAHRRDLWLAGRTERATRSTGKRRGGGGLIYQSPGRAQNYHKSKGRREEMDAGDLHRKPSRALLGSQIISHQYAKVMVSPPPPPRGALTCDEAPLPLRDALLEDGRDPKPRPATW